MPGANSVLVTALVALAAVGDGAYIAFDTWRGVQVNETTPRDALTTPAVNPFIHTELPSIDTIAQWPVFGRFAEKPVVPVAPPPTALALQLRAVFVDANPDATFAVIAESGSAPRPYSVGSALPGGATLHAIASDRVVLLRDGQYETLSFHAATATP